jgi:hypothetical protein
MRLTLYLAATLSALSLAACGTSQFEDDPLYDAGFSDGCSTGTSRSSGTPTRQADRDNELWRESEAYRAGWRQGYGACAPDQTGGR